MTYSGEVSRTAFQREQDTQGANLPVAPRNGVKAPSRRPATECTPSGLRAAASVSYQARLTQGSRQPSSSAPAASWDLRTHEAAHRNGKREENLPPRHPPKHKTSVAEPFSAGPRAP